MSNITGRFICKFSFLISNSITLANDKFKNHFTISSKYLDMVCYWKHECSFASISFEVSQNDVWTDVIQSFVLPFYSSTALETRVRPRFFDQVGHETMYASSGNKHFPSISYYFHIPKIFLNFFPHTGKNRNWRKSNLLP